MTTNKTHPTSHRLAERLRAELEGEVLFDAFSRGRYSTDASHYQVLLAGAYMQKARETTDFSYLDRASAMLDKVLDTLTPDNHQVAVALASVPEKIRGFGHVKQRHLAAAKADEAALFEQFQAGSPALLKAAE